MIDVITPEGGWVVSFAECYLDETETTEPRSVFAVSGLIFRKEAAIRQAESWRIMLAKWNLPFFHMTDCALGQGVFKELGATERDAAAREAIAIIRDTVSAYVYVTVEVSKFAEEIGILSILGGKYEWCAMSIMPLVATWCENNPDVKEVTYYFEDGGPNQANAAYRIAEMLAVDDHKQQCRYGGMGFVEKVRSPGVQAADIIAWHTGKDAKRAFAGQPMRRDLFELLKGIPAHGANWSAAQLRTIAEDTESFASEHGLSAETLAQIERHLRRSQKPGRSR